MLTFGSKVIGEDFGRIDPSSRTPRDSVSVEDNESWVVADSLQGTDDATKTVAENCISVHSALASLESHDCANQTYQRSAS